MLGGWIWRWVNGRGVFANLLLVLAVSHVFVLGDSPSASADQSVTEGSTSTSSSGSKKLDIIYAVNCGGDEHVDYSGVPYQEDTSKDGHASDYGTHWQTIDNAHPDDFILYQTERYAESTFGYDLPIPKQHKATSFVLVLKFAEVYFNQPQMKVFDVLLNGDHLIVDGLDIFERAGGRAAAYDVHVPFRITGNKLVLTHTGEESEYSGSLRLDFVKTSQDNPKCNAFYVARGSLEDIPKIEIKKKQTRQDEEDIERLRRKSQGEDESSSLNSDDSSWAASFDFPTPAPPPLAAEEVVGAFQLDKYYPVIVVFLFVAILTAFLFKL